MRVESCGPIFSEPKVGDIFFQTHRFSEPITIINPKSNFLTGEEDSFSRLSIVADSTSTGYSFENEEHPLPVGFFLTEEEWSLIKQPRLGVESYEQTKMCSLPKSFTPFAPTTTSGLPPKCSLSNEQIPDCNWLRKCESLSGTSSFAFLKDNELNNNVINDKPSSSKSGPQNFTEVVQEEVEEDEKENRNMQGQHLWSDQNCSLNNNAPEMPGSPDKVVSANQAETPQIDEATQQQNALGVVVNDFGMCFGAGQISKDARHLLSVGTVDSHPQPITSAGRDYNLHNHNPSLQHYQQCRTANPPNEDWSFINLNAQENYLQNWQQQYLINSDVRQESSNWNQNFGIEKQPSLPSLQRSEHKINNQAASGPGPSDEMETLLTFLSKFDDKVAAIWGHHDGAAFAASMPYSEGYLSTSSTPVGGNMYPWGSPASDQNCGQNYYDLRAMQIQIEQQQLLLNESQQMSQYRKPYTDHHPNFHQASVHLKPSISNRIAIGTSTIMPPKGKYTIMHSMKQHFGTAPSEDEYHIIRKVDVESSTDEKDKSLNLLNHKDESSGFTKFVPELHCKNLNPNNHQQLIKPVKSSVSSEIDIKHMQEILNGLDLEYEEELEIVAACKGNPKPFIEQSSQEDLLHSWKTHFSTVEALEKSNIYGQGSPSTTISAHQINPNLPEYRLFDGCDKEYNVFQHPGKTMFPVRYKLRPDNEKCVQTEDLHESSNTQNNMQQGNMHRLSIFDWSSFGTGNEYHFNLSSGSRTPLDTRVAFDYDNSLEIHTSDWFSDVNALGSGSLMEFDYGLHENNIAGPHTFPQSDYCCDSGIGIDGSSRTGFYDDIFPEYEGDYEYVGGGLDDGGTVVHGFISTNENDVDYGQFQGFSYNTWSNSSVSGKPGKNNRRKLKVKPCKYFLLDGSCRRGRDCKFSHELTTCRYWAEGSCLKGDSCPYLHCFVERTDYVGPGEYKFGGKRYHLESENDFPTLSSTKGNTTLSSRVPMSVSVGFPSSVTEGDAGSSTESLLMLADPAGSMYETLGFGLHPDGRLQIPSQSIITPEGLLTRAKHQMEEYRAPPLPPEPRRQRNGNRTRRGASDSGSSTPRLRQGKSNNGHNANMNNNWICSMISVKEKRKKKKH